MKNIYFLNSLFYAIVASFGGFLFGYHTAAISGALYFITKDFNLSTFGQEFLVSLILLGALFGSWLGGIISDKIGRKKTFFLSIIILFIGTFIFTATKIHLLLFTSRAIIGFSIGVFSTVVPIYIAEVSAPKYRGRLVSINQLFLVLGILISNIFGYFFIKTQNWEAIFIAGLIFALLMFICLFFIPESPSYLANQNRSEEAINILKKVRIDIKNSEVIKKIQSSALEKPKKISLLAKSVRSAFFVGIGINIFRQITGINIVTYYAPKIFQIAGLDVPHIAMLATALVTSINIIASIVAIYLIDKVGRRPLLIWGLFSMATFLFILGVSFYFKPSFLPILVMISLMGFTSSFAIGIGQVSWLINAEIYPMSIRGKAAGVATFVNWISNYVVALSFLTLFGNFGTFQTFFMFGIISVIALIFSIKKVPETKGKSFLEIQEFFNKKPN